MATYDYYSVICDDIRKVVEENSIDINNDDFDYDDFYDQLFAGYYDITGNINGSYFCNSYRAEEALLHNGDLLREAIEEFGDSESMYREAIESAETADVYIRCYLLSQCLNDVINEFKSEGE